MSYVPRTARIMTWPWTSFTHALQQSSRAIRAALGRLATLPYDSRETLATKDAQLAAYGVSWSTDLAYDTELAQELQAARRQRLTSTTAAPPLVPPPMVSEATDEGAVETPGLTLPATMGV